MAQNIAAMQATEQQLIQKVSSPAPSKPVHVPLPSPPQPSQLIMRQLLPAIAMIKVGAVSLIARADMVGSAAGAGTGLVVAGPVGAGAGVVGDVFGEPFLGPPSVMKRAEPMATSAATACIIDIVDDGSRLNDRKRKSCLIENNAGKAAVTMLGRSVRLAISSLVLCAASPAGSQGNLDQGKTAAQLYGSDCATCHKSPRSVSNTKWFFGLESFLSEHYTSSRESAAILAAYLEDKRDHQPSLSTVASPST